jgi:hypothetical protein
MTAIILGLWLFLVAVLCHEAGHLIAFALLGMRQPEVSLKSGAVYVESAESLRRPYWQMAYIAMFGVLTGAAFLLLTHAPEAVWTAYALACCIDLSGLWSFFGASRKAQAGPLIEAVRGYAAEAEKKYWAEARRRP